MYDVGDQQVAASVLSYRPDENDEGYFLLLVSPDIKRSGDKPLPKTVLFVVDRSGSMSGKKIEQAKGALNFVLDNLNEGDLFNIIAYDSRVESFQPELQRYDDRTRGEAKGYVEGIYAGGSTNIDGALQVAMAQLQDDRRPAYIVFLTDGLPTAGERREAQIVDNTREANKVRARVFTFGVGYDVNSLLLDKLTRACFGQSQYVRPNEDIEAHVAQLYQRIGAPAMVNVAIEFDLENFPADRGSPISRIYPAGAFDLFAGDQLVVVGRYKQPGEAKVTVRGKVDQTEQSFDFPARLVEHSSDDSQAFVEKLWALRRVGEIIDEIDLHGKNQELVNELVALATRHGILTPYTSFLADETANVRDLASNQARTGFALDALQLESGASAFGQRLMKNDLQRVRQAPASGYAPGIAADADLSGMGAGMGYPGMSSGGGYPGAADPGPSRLAAGRQSGVARSRGRSGGMPGMVGGAGAAISGPSDEAPVLVRTVLNAGKKTFFWRHNRWEDSALTNDQLKKVQKIKRFSEEYFNLNTRFGKDVTKYLAIEENVIVVLGGVAYEF